MMSLLLFLTFIWLLVLTIRNNRLEQIVQNLEHRLNHLQRGQHQPEDAAGKQPVPPPAAGQQHADEKQPQRVHDWPADSSHTPPQPQYVRATAAAERKVTVTPLTIPRPVETVTQDATPAYRKEEYGAEYSTEPLWPRIRPALVATGLWPDTRKGSLEAQLTTFIATRLGIILGIAALVFLAVYIGRNTPVWLRFVELLLVPTGMCIVARGLRNRAPAFARVVLAGAMAMFYFVSFAAYAIPGVRVIEQAWLGFTLQIATLLAIGIFAARRNDQPLAVLTQSLGFVACAFALYHGLTTYLLSGCFLLGTGGALLYASRQWRTCLWLGMAGTYGFYLLVIEDAQRLGVPVNWVQWLYPLCAYLMFFTGERLTAMRLQLPHERLSVIHHSVNTGLALIVGFIAIREFQPERLEYFYLGSTLVAAGSAWLFRQKPVSEWLTHQFTLKASVLFSLFLLEVLDGNLRCIALLLQALAMLEGVRRHPSKATLAAVVVAWLFSLGALLQVHFVFGRELWQMTTLWIGLYLFGSACLLLRAGRIVPRVVIAPINTALQFLGGILLGIATVATTYYSLYKAGDSIAAALINLLLLLAPLLAFIPAIAKRPPTDEQAPNPFLGIGVAIAIALLWTHLVAWHLLNSMAYNKPNDPERYWIGGTVILSVLLILCAGFSASKSIRTGQHVLAVITACTFYALTGTLFDETSMLLLMVLTGWLVVLLSHLPRYRNLTYLRLILFALAAVPLRDLQRHSPELTATFAAWCGLALAFGWQLGLPYWKALQGDFKEGGTQALHWIQAILLVFASLAVIFLVQDPLNRLLLFGGFTAATLCLHRVSLPHLWLTQSLALLFVAQIVSGQIWLGKSETFATVYLIQIGLSALTICLAQSICRRMPRETGEYIVLIQVAAGLVALLPLLGIPMELLADRTWLSLWYALPAFALVITGLLLHGRPYRRIGLVALLLPLGRLFAYDIRDTVQRIIAFGLLAAVLLLTGYIYNRILEGSRRDGKTDTDTEDAV